MQPGRSVRKQVRGCHLLRWLSYNRSDARLEDFVLELHDLEFDLLFLTEAWRDHIEETLGFCDGTKMFLSGCGPHQGVGVVVSQKCWALMQNV